MILITGATGFLGSHLLLELLKTESRVRALKRSHSDLSLLLRVFKAYSPDPQSLLSRIDWVEGDILDIFSLDDAMAGVDQVYHCAALVSFDSGKEKLLEQINVEGTANVVNVALKHQVKKLCHVSSIAAIGRGGAEGVITEDTHWKNSNFNSQYAISKYGAEREIWRGVEEGLRVVIVNPAIILGYGELNSGTARLFRTVIHGLKFYPVGTNGFVDVNDVARVMHKLMESEIVNKRFILSADNILYKDLLTMIAHSLGLKPPIFPSGRILTELGWRAEWLRARLFRAKPLLTRETAVTSLQHYIYRGSRITEVIDFRYNPIPDTIQAVANLMKKDGQV